MNRTHLERAAEALASKRGYAFVAAPDDRLPLAVTRYPAAVLAPLTLCAVEGRCHGRATYAMTLRLLRTAGGCTPEARRSVLAALETDLLELLGALTEDERVIAVEELTVRSGEGTLTPHGELSQTASARVITTF